MGHGLRQIATLRDHASQRATIKALHFENHYDAAYFNVSTALMLPVVQAAQEAGIPHVIVHAHAAANDQTSPARLLVLDAGNAAMRPVMRRLPSLKLACSAAAGRWLFGKRAMNAGEVHVVPNPVDVRACAFDLEVRKCMRKELGVENGLVVGSVTSMKAVKNPLFLIDVFRKFLVQRSDAVLVVVGDGEMAEEFRSGAERLLPKGSYRLLGKRSDVPALLQAFDAFLLTSHKEGLSIATVEAQAAGLPCLVSDGVPQEAAAVPGLVCRLPLADGPQAWADELAALCAAGRSPEARRGGARHVEAAGYSLRSPQVVLRMIQSHTRESI